MKKAILTVLAVVLSTCMSAQAISEGGKMLSSSKAKVMPVSEESHNYSNIYRAAMNAANGKKWTWDQSVTGVVWGNMGYLGGKGSEVGINGAGQWWGVKNEEDFMSQLDYTHDGKAHGDESMDAFFTLSGNGTITRYAGDGTVIKSGTYEFDTSVANEWKVANLRTTPGTILWPYEINSGGNMPSLFEVVYMTDDKLTLVYPDGGKFSELGNWGEATFWHFKSAGDADDDSEEFMVIEKTDGVNIKVGIDKVRQIYFEKPDKSWGKVADAVDLGLSVKWARWDVGASKIGEYGGLFGWADPSGEKTSKQLSDYPASTPPSDISGTEYDIAHVAWGGDWRLPTYEEIRELQDECKWYRDYVNGDSCLKVVGPNGNSIILPFAGTRYGTESREPKNGYFWSGTLYEDDTTFAWGIRVNHDNYSVMVLNRVWGFCVRPVSGKKMAPASLSVSPSELTLGSKKGSSSSVTITSNAEWNITGIPSWLSVSATSGKGDATITLTTKEEYRGTDDRAAETITVKTKIGNKTANVKVSQKGVGNLSITVNTVVVLSDGVALDFKLGKDVAYYYAFGTSEDISNYSDNVIIEAMPSLVRQRTDPEDVLSANTSVENSKITIYAIAYSDDGVASGLERFTYVLPSSSNQPFVDIKFTDTENFSSKISFKTTPNAYTSKYYILSQLGSYPLTTANWPNSVLAYHAYKAIIDNTVTKTYTGSQSLYSNNTTKATQVQLNTWGLTSSGKLSSRFNNVCYPATTGARKRTIVKEPLTGTVKNIYFSQDDIDELGMVFKLFVVEP